MTTLPKFPFKMSLPDIPEVHLALRGMNIGSASQIHFITPKTFIVKGIHDIFPDILSVVPAQGGNWWMQKDFIEKYCKPHNLNELVSHD